jgi:hypothetical protein
MGGIGVGMATDSTFIPQTSPRFGANACWGYNLAKHPGPERRNHPGRYAAAEQRDGVLYDGLAANASVTVGPNVPLKPYTMGPRKFDYNVDGFAHFGLVPDMLQDLKNLSMPRADLESLFDSADVYLAMWEKSARLASKR